MALSVTEWPIFKTNKENNLKKRKLVNSTKVLVLRQTFVCRNHLQKYQMKRANYEIIIMVWIVQNASMSPALFIHMDTHACKRTQTQIAVTASTRCFSHPCFIFPYTKYVLRL